MGLVRSKIEIKEMLYVKQSAVHGQMGKLTVEQQHDLEVQIDILEWVLSE